VPLYIKAFRGRLFSGIFYNSNASFDITAILPEKLENVGGFPKTK